MGKPNIRLNPQIDSIRNRVLLEKGANILLSIALLLPPPTKKAGRGRKPYDYRLVLVLCILRILLRKKYADYESEMRFDKRLTDMLKISKLPCKSTVNNYALMFTLSFLSSFNKELIEAWIKKPADLRLYLIFGIFIYNFISEILEVIFMPIKCIFCKNSSDIVKTGFRYN